jgi:hypothetical protein
MSTITILRRAAATLAVLSLAACVGAPGDETTGAEPADEQPVGVARSAYTATGTIYFSTTVGFLDDVVYQYVADVTDLGTLDNKANALGNDTAGPITMWAGKNFTGRCQVVPAHAVYTDLSKQDIGPNRLSSIQLGDHCAQTASTAQAFGPAGYTVKTTVNGFINASTTIAVSNTATPLPVRRNAWQVNVFSDNGVANLNVQSDEAVIGNVAVAYNASWTVYDDATYHAKGTQTSALYTFKGPVTSVTEAEDAQHIKQVNLVLP